MGLGRTLKTEKGAGGKIGQSGKDETLKYPEEKEHGRRRRRLIDKDLEREAMKKPEQEN